MLRTNTAAIQQKPKKLFKLNVLQVEHYNQFKGQAIDEEINQADTTQHPIHQNPDPHSDSNIHQQIQKYKQILRGISVQPRKLKKISDVHQHLAKKEQEQAQKDKKQVKLEEGTEIKTNLDKTKKITKPQKKKEPLVTSSNWKQFLHEQKSSKKQNKKNNKYEFVALDCQFVKAGETECLARISMVNEHAEVIYDSYVKPELKITDYVTEISGITYKHIKNAPSQSQAIAEVKKKLLNKICIGHTIDKDLSVCGLKNWNGLKSIIDIADYKMYSPGGKRISLKNLSYAHLGKTIQEGWHSSVEDAQATMDLFLKQKSGILKENNIIKK